MNLAMDRKIIMRQVEDSTQIYAASYFYMEANTATRLTQLNAVFDVPDIEIEDRIRKIEKKTGMDLDEHQVEAVKEAVRNGVLVNPDRDWRTGNRKNNDDQYDHPVF